MKKSKHFRKDVIMARVIAGVLVILLIVLIVLGVSLLTKSSGNDKDTQSTQNTQDVGNEDLEPDVDVDTEYETEAEAETESEEESEVVSDGKTYVETTTQVKLRKEPNTECATLDRIDGGTKLEVLETLDGWYKVIHNGQEGYVSADYAELVEE